MARVAEHTMLLAATPDGVYRVTELPFSSGERVLNIETTRQLFTRDDIPGVFAATEAGLFYTIDGGDTWTNRGVPVENVYSVLVSDGCIYAGVRPADIYASTDDGETWTVLTGFRESSFTSSWPTNPHRDYAHVRSLASHPTVPELLVAGVEVGGLVMSTDGGDSWRECPSVPDDVHHVLCITADTWVVSCGTGGPNDGGGVYLTDNSGETWEKLDTGERSYIRESCYHDRLYTAANRTAPLWTPPDAALLVEDENQLEAVSYPGQPTSFVISWETANDYILAGTNDGRILQGHRDDWRYVGTIPVSSDDQQAFGVTSLAIV